MEHREKLEASIDWLSCTLPDGDSNRAIAWDSAVKLQDELNQQGYAARKCRLQGYDGVMVGKLFVGENDQGLFIRATSSAAMLAYQHLYIPEMHVSRLDIQVTDWNPKGLEFCGVQAEHQAKARKLAGGRGANRQIRHIADDEGGYTLYVGSKTSESFMRLYNKGAESKDEYYTGAWRYEVELHNELATQTARYLANIGNAIESSIIVSVRQYVRERGITVYWDQLGGDQVIRPLPYQETDDERSIIWLGKQVKPTVQRLVKAGYLVDILEALGLDSD